MFALGVATIMGSFFSAYPISASFGRSSVQFQSGVKTTLSNIYGGNLSLILIQTALLIVCSLFSVRNFGIICFGVPDAVVSVHSEICPCRSYYNFSHIHGGI